MGCDIWEEWACVCESLCHQLGVLRCELGGGEGLTAVGLRRQLPGASVNATPRSLTHVDEHPACAQLGCERIGCSEVAFGAGVFTPNEKVKDVLIGEVAGRVAHRRGLMRRIAYLAQREPVTAELAALQLAECLITFASESEDDFD